YEYPAGPSFAAAEHSFDLTRAHGVKILRDVESAAHEAKTGRLLRLVQRDNFDQGLAGLGDDNGFASRNAFDDAGQVCLGLVNIYRESHVMIQFELVRRT